MRNSNSQKQKPKAAANRYTHSTVRLGDLTTPLDKRAASESKAVGRRVTASAIIKKALRGLAATSTSLRTYSIWKAVWTRASYKRTTRHCKPSSGRSQAQCERSNTNYTSDDNFQHC